MVVGVGYIGYVGYMRPCDCVDSKHARQMLTVTVFASGCGQRRGDERAEYIAVTPPHRYPAVTQPLPLSVESDAATSEPRQREPKLVVRARRRERAVGFRGTFGCRKYLP